MCLAPELRERTERGVYAASAWLKPEVVEETRRPRNLPTLKRPEGRALPLLLIGALNTYSPQEREKPAQWPGIFMICGAALPHRESRRRLPYLNTCGFGRGRVELDCDFTQVLS
jgi:hypothetical protein